MPDRMWIYWPQQLSNRLWEATPAGPENGNPAASKSPNLIPSGSMCTFRVSECWENNQILLLRFWKNVVRSHDEEKILIFIY